MNAKIQEAADVVAAKWAYLRDMREQQIQAQARLEALTEKTMQASWAYDKAVEELALIAREVQEPPLPPNPWTHSVTGEEARKVGPCANCGHQIHYTEKYKAWFHSDGRPQCLSGKGTWATPYGYGLDDEPDGE